MRRLQVLRAASAMLVLMLAPTAMAQETSCVLCHGDAELFTPEEAALVTAYGTDIHAEYGLSCHDCHGGNPDPALFEDMDLAMSPEYRDNPYRGAPSVGDAPEFCGRCHADAAYMRGFRPDVRVDQLAEYRTSRHGLALAAGDTAVATCVSCHGVHGMRPADDPQSRVHPTRVGATCAECHADAERMAGRETDAGAALPIDQYALWQQSVHASAMFDREDLSAPTCNDCHGNHGAAPPGLGSVNFVCGQCHGREASVFRDSAKRRAFEEHNEYLAEAGADGCAACHSEPEPQAAITLSHLGECASCHGNHGIVRPSLSMLSPLPETPCAICHEGPGAAAGDAADVTTRYQAERDGLLAEAATLALDDGARYDWLIDRARSLEQHGAAAAESEAGAAGREFTRLYDKFRIGKTTYEYTDPASGQQRTVPVLRCAGCHVDVEQGGEDAVGYGVSATILERMRELTGRTAAAERALLRARRGGVETRAALLAVDQAVDAQIGLEVLLHAFDVGEDSEFLARHAEGMEHAIAAATGAQAALDELSSRRRGLFVSLAIIGVLLVLLALKIREVSARDSGGPS